jgi:hypothetical protein
MVWADRFNTDTGIVVPAFLEGISEILLTEVLYIFGEDFKIHTKEYVIDEGSVVYWTNISKATIMELSLTPDPYEILMSPEDDICDGDDEPEDGRWNYFGGAE